MSPSQITGLSAADLQKLIVQMVQENQATNQQHAQNTLALQQAEQAQAAQNLRAGDIAIKNATPNLGRTLLQTVVPGLALAGGLKLGNMAFGGSGSGSSGGGLLSFLNGGGASSAGSTSTAAGETGSNGYNLTQALGGSNLFPDASSAGSDALTSADAASSLPDIAAAGPEAIAAVLAPYVAAKTISGVGKFAQGDHLNFGEQAALALPTFGLSFASNLFGNGPNYRAGVDRSNLIDELSGGTGDLKLPTSSGGTYDVTSRDFAKDPNYFNSGSAVTPDQIGEANSILGITGANQPSTEIQQLASLFSNALNAGVDPSNLKSLVSQDSSLGATPSGASTSAVKSLVLPNLPDTTPSDNSQYAAALPPGANGLPTQSNATLQQILAALQKAQTGAV